MSLKNHSGYGRQKQDLHQKNMQALKIVFVKNATDQTHHQPKNMRACPTIHLLIIDSKLCQKPAGWWLTRLNTFYPQQPGELPLKL